MAKASCCIVTALKMPPIVLPGLCRKGLIFGVACGELVFKFVCFPLCIQVSTGAYEKIVFQTSSGKHITDTNLIGKIVWASWTR